MIRKPLNYILGTIFFLVGIYMWFYFVAFIAFYLGWILGVILGFILTPGLVIFPFVFWYTTGNFPTMYFIAWGIGLVTMTLLYFINRNTD